MDNRLGTFLLGVIAAVVLIMLWKKETGHYPGVMTAGDAASAPDGAGCGGSCSGCSLGLGGGCPGASASPSVQSSVATGYGTEGSISPGTPPLNAATGGQGATSYYTNSGVTPDTSFTFTPVNRNTTPGAVGSPVQPKTGLNVPGSPTTPSTVTPTRATQQVPNYGELGAWNNYNVNGVPRKLLPQTGYIQ